MPSLNSDAVLKVTELRFAGCVETKWLAIAGDSQVITSSQLGKNRRAGRCVLAIYPEAPGVKTPRPGGELEKFFHVREKLAQAIHNELTTKSDRRDRRHGREDDDGAESSCTIL